MPARPHRNQRRDRRRGAAAAELAVVLPMLMILVVGIVDFCRLFHHLSVVANCARNGALYACDDTAARDSPYYNASNRTASVQAAALADAAGISPTPTVTLVSDTSTYVEVRVTHTFNMLTSYLGFGSVTLTRTVRMEKIPQTPS
jgi:Flp pilus assembly protein TadG